REGAPVYAVEGASTRGGVGPPEDVGVTHATDGERDDVRVRRDADLVHDELGDDVPPVRILVDVELGREQEDGERNDGEEPDDGRGRGESRAAPGVGGEPGPDPVDDGGDE